MHIFIAALFTLLMALPAGAQEMHSAGNKCNKRFSGAALKLNPDTHIYFETDSAALDEKYIDDIERIYERAKGQHVQQICLFGKASKKGDPAYNARLARKRSEAVAREFQRLGWPASDIAIEPEGEAWGWVQESLSWDAQADRRVRIKLSM